MLPSFEVENFRTFSHLQIPHLGGVNLIVGRNNVGKSMLLEALRLYAAEGDINAVLGLLYDRDELLPSPSVDPQQRSLQIRFASLFYGRVLPDANKSSIVLQTSSQDRCRVRMTIGSRVYSAKTVSSDYDASNTTILAPWEEKVAYPVITVHVGDQAAGTYRLDASMRANREAWAVEKKRLALAFVPAGGVDSRTLARQWDAGALRTVVEEQVIECLRMIAPIERITSVEHPANSSQRVFLARTAGAREPVPLRSLGDGMVRMFQLALALESAKSRQTASAAPPRSLVPETASRESEGIFLIDEIENGIHYTVLPDLWRFLFRMAKLHNVQVFATTHSWDCVEAFQKAAVEAMDLDGTLIRLEQRDDSHRVVTFSEKELAIVTRDKIEVR